MHGLYTRQYVYVSLELRPKLLALIICISLANALCLVILETSKDSEPLI